MQLTASTTRGFTLIELLIALAIAALLLMLAAPGLSVWIADNQIANGAQLIEGGLQFARAEAIKRNDQIQLVLDPTPVSGGWSAQLTDGTVLRSGKLAEGADKVQLAVAPAGLDTVTFSGLGQIVVPNTDASLPFTSVDITSTVANTRPLRVVVGGNVAGVRVCDPAWPSTDPKGCP